jgi:hypothetical protein
MSIRERVREYEALRVEHARIVQPGKAAAAVAMQLAVAWGGTAPGPSQLSAKYNIKQLIRRAAAALLAVEEAAQDSGLDISKISVLPGGRIRISEADNA